MKTVVASSIITLLCVFAFFQFRTNQSLELANENLWKKITEIEQANRIATSRLPGDILPAVDAKIRNASYALSDDFNLQAKAFATTQSVAHIKFETERLESELDQLKRAEVEDIHDVRGLLFKLDAKVKAP